MASPKVQTLCLSGVVIKQQHYFKKCFIDSINVYTPYLFKIFSVGSCALFCNKNLSGLVAFPDVISQGRHFKLLCRLSIHLNQHIEGFGCSFLHFHAKLMFSRYSVFEIKLHRDKFKGTGYKKKLDTTSTKRSVVLLATVGSLGDSFLLSLRYHKNNIIDVRGSVHHSIIHK
jgi:hypothetical protein